jgi:Fic family protein
MYIHELPDWPLFTWDHDKITSLLVPLRHHQGRFIGHMESLGFRFREQAVLQTLTQDVLKSSEIEGEILDYDQVRSSIARRLGMDIGGMVAASREVEGVVNMMLDATRHYNQPLSKERLFSWHAALFPTGNSGLMKIKVGAWRNDSHGPMQVVSGPYGHEHVHYQAPPASKIDHDIALFLEWFNQETSIDPILKASLAHLWFVTIHPFDDGNGRIARAIADMALAQSEQSSQRFYSLSSQIKLERKDYYKRLESTQKGSLDVTHWMEWFLGCMERAIQGAESISESVFRKARFWEELSVLSLNDRQRKVLTLMLDGFEGKLTSSKWAKLTKCSQDTAYRDIISLVDQGVLTVNPEGGRSTSYSLTD